VTNIAAIDIELFEELYGNPIIAAFTEVSATLSERAHQSFVKRARING